MFDVVATDGTTTVFSQVKTYKKKRPSYVRDRIRMEEIPGGPGVRKILAIYGPRIRGRRMRRQEIKL